MEKKDDDYIEAKFKFPSPFRVSFFLINGVDDNENVVGLQTGRDTLMDIQLNGMKMSKWTLIFYSKGSNINIS